MFDWLVSIFTVIISFFSKLFGFTKSDDVVSTVATVATEVVAMQEPSPQPADNSTELAVTSAPIESAL